MTERRQPEGSQPASVGHGGAAPTPGPGGPTELFESLQRELRLLAAAALARERRDHTLQPTALLNALSLRLAKDQRLEFESRSASLAFASAAVRNILVDHGGSVSRRAAGRDRQDLDRRARNSTTGRAGAVDLEDELSRLGEIHRVPHGCSNCGSSAGSRRATSPRTSGCLKEPSATTGRRRRRGSEPAWSRRSRDDARALRARPCAFPESA